jgi:hypothetical protein
VIGWVFVLAREFGVSSCDDCWNQVRKKRKKERKKRKKERKKHMVESAAAGKRIYDGFKRGRWWNGKRGVYISSLLFFFCRLEKKTNVVLHSSPFFFLEDVLFLFWLGVCKFWERFCFVFSASWMKQFLNFFCWFLCSICCSFLWVSSSLLLLLLFIMSL